MNNVLIVACYAGALALLFVGFRILNLRADLEKKARELHAMKSSIDEIDKSLDEAQDNLAALNGVVEATNKVSVKLKGFVDKFM